MKVFISGPMSGKPNGNKEVFFRAEYKLKGLGYSVFNPAWFRYGAVTEFTTDDMHMIDFSALSRCDAIYMLKGWQYSIGARAEFEHAKELGKKILREGDPITDPLKYGKYDWESWKNKLPDSLDSKKIDSLEKWRNDFAESYTVNITNLRKEVEAIKESIGTDNLQEQLEKDFADVYTEFQNTKDKVNEIEFSNIDMSCKMSSAIDEMTKVKETVKGLNSLVATLGERNDVLSDKFESGIEENRHYRLSVTEQLGTIRSRLKAIDNLENTNEVHWINIQGLDKKLDELIHNVAELEKDQVDINSKVAKKLDDYKEAYMHLDNADEALERRIKALENSVNDIRRIVNNSNIENISIKAMNDRMNRFDRKLDQLNTAIDICGKDIGSIVQKRCDDNRTINNTLNDLNIRLKAIEKRLSIKPFYAPTEDEKDD